jgi:hypothetical protein
MLEAQATTGRTAIAWHSASCDILPRSGRPTGSGRAGLAKNIETLTTPASGIPPELSNNPSNPSKAGVTHNEECIEKRKWKDKCDR